MPRLRCREIEAEQAAQNVTLNKLVAKMKSVNCDIKALHGDIDALRGAVKTLHGGTKPVKGDIGTVRDDTKRAKGDIKSLLGAIEDLQATLTTQGEALGTLVETSILVRRHLSKEDKRLRRSALTSTGEPAQLPPRRPPRYKACPSRGKARVFGCCLYKSVVRRPAACWTCAPSAVHVCLTAWLQPAQMAIAAAMQSLQARMQPRSANQWLRCLGVSSSHGQTLQTAPHRLGMPASRFRPGGFMQPPRPFPPTRSGKVEHTDGGMTRGP